MSNTRRILLLSTSTLHGGGYLDYAEAEVLAFLAGISRLLFVPFALHDHAGYVAPVRERFARIGCAVDSVHEAADPERSVREAEAIFIGGGNTFRLLKSLQELHLLATIRERVAQGMPYLGSSAGSNVAAPTIRTTNDMPIVEPLSFEALGLVSFQINPHYLDADPASTHMGETREERILQFLEENDIPVIGLREGAMLRIDGPSCRLMGVAGARLFRRGKAPREVQAGSVLDLS